MEYKDFGSTGIKISRLGFGAMRLPMVEINGEKVVDDEKAIAMIHRAFELGVNYIDTAYFYCDHLSENTVGKALKGWRDKVHLSTKYPFDGELREVLETQLKKLDTDHIDFYHFHGIGESYFTRKDHDSAVKQALQAKEEGLIKHLSFSFHDKPEVMSRIIDEGIFESVLCQYNLLDRGNEKQLAYAKTKGLGTIIMGPVGGGRVSGMPKETAEKLGIQVKGSAELALRFVFANPDIDCVLSGMETIAQVEENVQTATNTLPLSLSEIENVNAAMEQNKKLADLYCTGCNYCLPHCVQEVNIPHIFQAMNYYKVYNIKDYARGNYQEIGISPWVKGKKADACIDCGICEEHCPQKIEIRKQLKECMAVFS